MAHVAAGLLLGTMLGWAGSFITGSSRSALVTLLAAVGFVVGLADLLGRRLPLLESSRETPQAWLNRRGALGWSVRNGLALGSGFASRIGFWLWYAVPFSALFSGSVLRGALIYGAYSLARGVGVLAVMFAPGYRNRGDTGLWVIGRSDVARTMAAVLLVLVSAAAMLTFGV